MQIKFIENFSGGGNELNMKWEGNSSMLVIVQNQQVQLTPVLGYLPDLLFGWRRHCFTYKSGEIVKVFYYATFTYACYTWTYRLN